MMRPIAFLAVLAIAAPLAGAPAANPKVVMLAVKRAEAIRAAHEVLTPRKPAWRERVAELADPFYRTNFTPTAVVQDQPVERPQEATLDTLRRVAAEIRPTGTLLIGDEPYLLINGRRYKVGDQVTLTFEGLVYQVAISSIERNQYTLRLNDQELRREFK